MSIEFVYIGVRSGIFAHEGRFESWAHEQYGFEQYGNLSEHLDWLKNEKSASMAYVFLSSNFHLVAFYATMSIRGIHIALNTFQRFGKYNIR